MATLKIEAGGKTGKAVSKAKYRSISLVIISKICVHVQLHGQMHTYAYVQWACYSPQFPVTFFPWKTLYYCACRGGHHSLPTYYAMNRKIGYIAKCSQAPNFLAFGMKKGSIHSAILQVFIFPVFQFCVDWFI